MPRPTSFEPSKADQDPVFWLARVKSSKKRKAEAKRIKMGHDKKEAIAFMIDLYLAHEPIEENDEPE